MRKVTLDVSCGLLAWPPGRPCVGCSILVFPLPGQDYTDTELLLSRENVDQEALLNYAREAADFSTQQQLPSLDFAINHYGQPDVAMFDFTCMYASENAALVREQNGHQLLVALVGDSLLEVSTEGGREWQVEGVALRNECRCPGRRVSRSTLMGDAPQGEKVMVLVCWITSRL